MDCASPVEGGIYSNFLTHNLIFSFIYSIPFIFFQQIQAQDLNMHIESGMRTHMDQLFGAFLGLKSNMEKLYKENQELRERQDMLLGSIRGDFIQKLKMKNFDFHPEYVEFMWQIENIEAKWGIDVDLESPALTSGSKGYLFCLNAYFCSSSSALFSNRPVFNIDVKILHGPHDDILPWPCKSVCEITLINQNKVRNDTRVVDDWRDKDFNPVRKKSLSAWPPLSKNMSLEGYVINNNIYIKFKLQKYSAE